MKRINALFIGGDSLGFKHGKRYDLEIWEPKRGEILIGRLVDNHMTVDESGIVRYSNIGKFFDNWDYIHNI